MPLKGGETKGRVACTHETSWTSRDVIPEHTSLSLSLNIESPFLLEQICNGSLLFASKESQLILNKFRSQSCKASFPFLISLM